MRQNHLDGIAFQNIVLNFTNRVLEFFLFKIGFNIPCFDRLSRTASTGTGRQGGAQLPLYDFNGLRRFLVGFLQATIFHIGVGNDFDRLGYVVENQQRVSDNEQGVGHV